MEKRIAIVGGGYLGSEVAKGLDHVMDVVLIEPNSHFTHAIAAIRALVQPALLDKVLLPYDRLLKRGKVVRGRAVAVDGQGVTLQDGSRIAADYILLATGSGNAPMFKPAEDGIAGLRAANARIHGQIQAARRIAIVGAGAVGTELAGEIAHAMPGKEVTLISSDASLFPMMPPALGRKLLAKLSAMGVKVILGAKAQNLASLSEPYAGRLALSNGQDIEADLIIPAIGAKVRSDLLAALPGAAMGTMNRVRTDGWMRPSTLPNVFAAGDAADMGDPMTALAAGGQRAWLVKTLTALSRGKRLEDLKPYSPTAKGKVPILIPLGPKKGASNLVALVAGDFLTSQLKGKHVFIGRYLKLFGLA